VQGAGGSCFKVFLLLMFLVFLHKLTCSYFYARGQINWSNVSILEVDQRGTLIAFYEFCFHRDLSPECQLASVVDQITMPFDWDLFLQFFFFF